MHKYLLIRRINLESAFALQKRSRAIATWINSLIAVVGINIAIPINAEVIFETVALTGVSGADPRGPQLGDGVSFSSFFVAGSTVKSINSSGQVAFAAFLTYPDMTSVHSYWSGMPGSLQLLGRGADAAPGTEPGVKFGTFWGTNINSSGQVAFFSDLTGPSSDAGLYSGPSGSPQLVARALHAAPGTGPNVNFQNLNFQRINSSALFAHRQSIDGEPLTRTGLTSRED